ncbi:unnamed protein product [Paramecium primaurelia]|uniref:Cystatin domain-containing protein n=1 Tax=Paramecium primaurelia TaxID=5886 RepID=A0A8S1Q1I0_PARPR|nr:unnamed protein product [Paramecium primaurelia]
MAKLLLVILVLSLHVSLNESISIPSLNHQVQMNQKPKKKPAIEWRNTSEFENNPTYVKVVEVAKNNFQSQCNMNKTITFSKVLQVAKKIEQGFLWSLQVEFSDKSIKIIQIFEDLDGNLEFDSCKDNF